MSTDTSAPDPLRPLASSPHGRWRRIGVWVIGSTVLATVAAFAVSTMLPKRYVSSASIKVFPPTLMLPNEYVRSPVTESFADRLLTIQQQVLSRTRLEEILNQLHIYVHERSTEPLEVVVERMRRDITIEAVAPGQGAAADAGMFRVSYMASDPQVAQKVAQRLTSAVIDQSTRDESDVSNDTSQFLSSASAETRQRLVDCEQQIEQFRAQHAGRAPSQAVLIEFQVLQDEYKALLADKAASDLALEVTRRQIGTTFKLIEVARVPDQPVSPNRVRVSAIGALVGCALGLVAAIPAGRRSRR
jgi:uncharacterized protein involved in exopolysaccharide biosynthesis